MDKAEAKQIQEYASSESLVQMPIGLFSHGEAENMKDAMRSDKKKRKRRINKKRE